MYKGIFWTYMSWFDDEIYVPVIFPIKVKCDINGNALEEVEFSSKSGENFNHKAEWEKKKETSRLCRNHPFDYFPRGRVEIRNGKIYIYANPVIISEDEAKKLIIETFELEDALDNIAWIADNSEHYKYFVDIWEN